LLSGANVIKKV